MRPANVDVCDSDLVTATLYVTPIFTTGDYVVASDDGFIIAYNVAESQTTRHIEAVRIGAQPPIPRHRGVR